MRMRNSTTVGVGLLALLLIGLPMLAGRYDGAPDRGAVSLVRDDSPQTRPASLQADAYLDDVWLTAKVKAGLLKDDLLNGLDIQVRSEQGIVRLSGYVNTARQAGRAGRAAGRVEGVRRLHNELLLRNWTRPGVWQGGRSHGYPPSARGVDPRHAVQWGVVMLSAYPPRGESLWIAALMASASVAPGGSAGLSPADDRLGM